jgi:membrane fusion protein (multidrug efflux system)
VYADFSLPQQNLSQLKTGQAVQVTCDAYPDQKFDGVLTAINPDLDSTTRSVTLQATFANTNQLLRPGMFVRAAVTLPQAQPVLAIPATAILSAPFGDSVYVIDQSTNSAGGLVVRQQFVRTGTGARRFCERTDGIETRRTRRERGTFQIAQRRARDDQQRHRAAAGEKSAGQLI